MKFYNYLFENDFGPFFVYCETGYRDAFAQAEAITTEEDAGELFYNGVYNDDDAEYLGFDTF